MKKITEQQLAEVLAGFDFGGAPSCSGTYGNGHINDTFLLTVQGEGGVRKVILQRINTEIFTMPRELMANICGVTGFLRAKIAGEGGDPDREVLSVLPAKDGGAWYADSCGDYWRAYPFIAGSYCIDQPSCPEEIYEGGFAFGRFQSLLSDYPVDSLAETIPGFHDTRVRLANLKRAAKEDRFDRLRYAQREVDFALGRAEIASRLPEMAEQKALPLRVTHNDTKLNNVLFDQTTHRGLCVVDLDTVMPGLAVNDFGDAIRYGANTAAEDETNLDLVSLDFALYEQFAEGFVRGCGGRLTKEEILLLPEGARSMTYENGIRFLADFLDGDVYFKTSREFHNLDRARTQFALIEDMEKKWPQMLQVVNALA